MKKYITLIKVLLIILFIGCLLNMPYGYFQLVRFMGMAIFIIFSLNEDNKNFKLFWIFSAILINPFIKVSLGRTIWNLLDIIWVIIICISIIHEKRSNKNGL